MTQDKSKSQDQTDSVVNDPALNKQAVDEAVSEYEQSANSDERKELDPPTQKELGDVERALEDTVLGIEDASWKLSWGASDIA